MKTLVISVRGCHLGYLGCYGCGWVSTPALNRLAATSFVFDHHFANVPDTDTARRSWRDGLSHLPCPARPDGASSFDLLAALRGAGVKALLVADGSRPLPDSWTQGWDEAEVVRGDEQQLEQTLEVGRAALEALAGDQQGLVWIDLATLLPPWRVPADFADPYFHDSPDLEEEEVDDEDEDEDEDEVEEMEEEEEEDPLTPWPDPPLGPIDTSDDIDFCRLQSTFAGAVSYLDAGIGVLLDELKEDEWTVILLGDHGLPLGEHGFCGSHRPWLHEELIHVPLVLRLPGRAGTRIAALTQTVDLVPTLLELFGVAVPGDLPGRSLLALTQPTPETENRAAVCCGLRIGDAVEWSLRSRDWNFLLPLRTPPGDPPRKPQLFVKPDDRWEVNDVVQHHLDRADALEKTLRDALTAPAPSTGTS